MAKANIFQDNYAKWRFNVVDETNGAALDTGNQWATPEEAERELEYWLELHPDVAAAGVSVFRDGATSLVPPAIRMPKVDAAREAERAGLSPQGVKPLPPMPAGWNEIGERQAPAAATVVAPDAGISERGVEELNPQMMQRKAFDEAMKDA